MKQFFAFVKKEFYHIVRDNRTLLILLGMPIAQILLFGFAINIEVQDVRTVIFDLSQDAISKEIGTHIASNRNLKMLGYVHSNEEIESMMRKGEVDMAIVFEANFSENLTHAKKAQIQVITDTSDPNKGTIASNYALAIIGDYQKELSQTNHIPYEIEPVSRMLYNPELKSTYTFVPGVMGLVLTIICSIMTSVSIVREKERGTMEVLLASPVKPATILLAKAIPYLALSFVNLVTILLLSFFVLKVPIQGNLILLLAISTLFIFLSLSLGLLISTLVRTQVTAILISAIGLMMPTLILSGMIFPIFNMPLPLQWLSHIVPTRWYIAAVKKVMIEGQGILSIVKELSIILGMIVLFLTLSIKNIKYRLE